MISARGQLVGVIAALMLMLVPMVATAKPVKVVTTLSDLAALAKAVGGADVQVTALVPANADAHYIDARPNLMLPLSRADLVIVNGLQLEVGWLPPLLRNSRNGKVQRGAPGYLNASAQVKRLQVPVGKVSRSMGDVHPGGNPHFTHDPRAAIQIVQAIAKRLAKLDPPRAAAYQRRAQQWTKQATAFVAAQQARFAKIPAKSRQVVAYHQSLVYLFDWLHLRQVTTVEPRPGIPPNPGHTAKVLTTMRSLGARIIVTEPYYPNKVSKTLARLAKGAVVTIPGGTRFPNERYLQRAERAADAIHAALVRTAGAAK
ncbi:MAG: zinc ABC transporter substrate-binding protein [Myxococcales bacterium]|nr:zinc ABC transporter substrate-binding protein [Myxococcales bacterium]